MTKLHMKIFPSNAMMQIKSTVPNFSYQYTTHTTIHITKPVKHSTRITSIRFYTNFKWALFSYKRKYYLK